ncbi:MAG: hypothetical protein M0Z53_05965 [Thermaerobacter sp.]|nr:hypothetical protein [Thermaerobacter sp.]
MGRYLPEAYEAAVARRLAALRGPVTLTVSDRHPATRFGLETCGLLDDLAQLAPGAVRVLRQATQGPAPVVHLQAETGRVSPVVFWGTPSGHTWEGLLLAVEAADGRPPAIADTEQALLSALPRAVRADIFVAPT